MTDRELMQQALVALEDADRVDTIQKLHFYGVLTNN